MISHIELQLCVRKMPRGWASLQLKRLEHRLGWDLGAEGAGVGTGAVGLVHGGGGRRLAPHSPRWAMAPGTG